MSVALIAVFVLVALALVAGGLYLFSSGLTARAGACRPPLGLRLPGVEPGSEEWERAQPGRSFLAAASWAPPTGSHWPQRPSWMRV